VIESKVRCHPTLQTDEQRIRRFIDPIPGWLDIRYQRNFAMERLVDHVERFAGQA
jgi:hypothetical protein